MSKEIEFEDFCKVPNKVFKIIGFFLIKSEPEKSKSAKFRAIFLKIYQIFQTINYFLLVLLLAAQVYVYRDNPKQVFDKLPDTMNLSVIAFKFYILYSNRDKIGKSLMTMKEIFVSVFL
jgi:hypothetical protein